jgi:dihydrofolate reductase
MRKIILYIAQSADGKIARPDGSVDWLENIPNPEKTDYGYASFYESVDTTIMGNSTYRKILNFDVPFPYPDKKNYVLTRNKVADAQPYVTFTSGEKTYFSSLKSKPGKDIWLVGGAQANTWFLQHGLIDEMFIFIMPVLIGKGIPLFDNFNHLVHLKPVSTKSYKNGVVFLKYRLGK